MDEVKKLKAADDATTELILADRLEENGEDGTVYRLAGQVRFKLEHVLKQPYAHPSWVGRKPEWERTKGFTLDERYTLVLRVKFARKQIETQLLTQERKGPTRKTGCLILTREVLKKNQKFYLRDKCRELARMLVNHAEWPWCRKGQTRMGLLYAQNGHARIVVFHDGNYTCQKWTNENGWSLYPLDNPMPDPLGRLLCKTLGIEWTGPKGQLGSPATEQ